MMEDLREDKSIVADRVAIMHARTEVERGRKANWPMIGSVAGLVFFAGVWTYVYLSKNSLASTEAGIAPGEAVTHDDQARAQPSSLFGDTSLDPEPEVPDSELLAVKEQLAQVLKELKEAKVAATTRHDLPQATKDELAAMRNEMDTMKSDFKAKVESYEGYIAQLKQQYEDANRLPPRPVSLQDSKWIRAQHITISDDTGEAARLAAPSMVFDGSKAKLDEEEDDTQIIIEQFGRSFPENVTLTPAAQ